MRTEIHKNMDDNIDKLRHLIRDIKVAMLTTVAPDGSLHSRPMATQEADFEGELWFFTSNRSGKVLSIQQDQHVNVTYASPTDNRYISVNGTAEVVPDKDKAKELWTPILKAWFPEGLEDPELILIRVRVMTAEYWDVPSNTFVNLVGFIKARVKGERFTPGEHARVDLQ